MGTSPRTKYKRSNNVFDVTSIALSLGHVDTRLLQLPVQSLIWSPLHSSARFRFAGKCICFEFSNLFLTAWRKKHNSIVFWLVQTVSFIIFWQANAKLMLRSLERDELN